MDLDDEELKATKILNGAANRFQIKEYIKKNYIPKQKVKDLIKNETINISGFECIAIEDIEELLEDK